MDINLLGHRAYVLNVIVKTEILRRVQNDGMTSLKVLKAVLFA